jgi:hypothetical protein
MVGRFFVFLDGWFVGTPLINKGGVPTNHYGQEWSDRPTNHPDHPDHWFGPLKAYSRPRWKCSPRRRATCDA